MRRWLVYRFSPWLLFWSSLIFGGIWLCTESGLQWLVLMARPQLPAALSVSHVEGSLLQGVRVRDLEWDDGQTRIGLKSGQLGWRLRSLMHGKIHLDPVRLNGLTVMLGETKENVAEPSAPAPVNIPQLPGFEIGKFEINNFRFRAADGREQKLERLRVQLAHEDGSVQLKLQELLIPGYPAMVGRLGAHLRRSGIRIDSLAVGMQSGGSASLEGDVDFSSGIRAEGALALQDFDPTFLASGLVTALDGSASFSANLPENPEDLLVELRDAAFTGQWQQRAWQLDAPGLSWHRQQLDIRDLRLRHGSDSVWANGKLGATHNLKISLNIADLAVISNDLAGKIQIDGLLTGHGEYPVASLNGGLQAFRWQQYRLTQAQWTGQLSTRRGLASQWQLTAKGIDAGGVIVDTFRLQLDGPPKALNIAWNSSGPDWSSDAKAQIDLRDRDASKLAISDLQLDYAGIEQWRLTKSGVIVLGKDRIRVAEHCLNGQGSSLCGQFRSDSGAQQGQAALRNYPLMRILQHAGQQDVQLDGEISLQAQFSGAPGRPPRVQGHIATSPVRISRIQDGSPLDLLALNPGQGSVQLDEEGLAAALRISASNAPGLSVRLKADRDFMIEDGVATLELTDLGVLTLLSPEILEATGEIGLRTQLSGNLRQSPQLSLQAELRDGSFLLNTPQLQLQQTRVELVGDLQQLSLQASTQSGEGTLQIGGAYQLAEQRGLFRVNGENFTVFDTELARVLLEPDLKLSVEKQRIDLTGLVRVPFADIHPEDLPESGSNYVAPSADQVILQDEQSDTAPVLQVFSRIKVELGEKVRFSGFGLNTGIRGALDLRSEPEKKPVATGMLELDGGTYKAYGQDLTIERGRIIFSGGAVDVPGIDLRAYRKPSSSVTVGIQLRGTAQKPQMSLWSEPEMAQTDQLSWLVLGRSAQGGSEEDQASLQNAALALGLKGSDFLAKQVKGKLGLDEVSIGTRPGEQSNQAALVLGKYLNPRIYVSYGIGLFEPIYTFRMRYSISDKWTLQTESGVESSGDLVYTIER